MMVGILADERTEYLEEYSVKELKVELRLRGFRVSGLKVDLNARLLSPTTSPMASVDGFRAAAWVTQVTRQRPPLQAFASEADLSSWDARTLTGSMLIGSPDANTGECSCRPAETQHGRPRQRGPSRPRQRS